MTKIFACLQADWYLRVSSPVRQLTSGQSPRTSVHIGSVRYVSSHRVSSPVRQLTSGQFPGTSAHIGSVPRYVSSHRVGSPVRRFTSVSSPVRQFTSGQFTGTSAHTRSVPRYVSSQTIGAEDESQRLDSVKSARDRQTDTARAEAGAEGVVRWGVCVWAGGGGGVRVCVWRGEGGRDR